ncbi:hypothetical protein ABIS04_04205 [Shewanella sp. H8]|uniref:hypothetical protein n=1 Tax=Shewanella sp. H8 TaxID=3342676 RepID=UPI0033148BA4
MDKLLITWIMLQIFSLFIIFFAGNSKTYIGKKVKEIGIALCIVTNFVQLSFFGSTLSATVKDIFFVLGLVMTLVIMYKLVSILKAIASTER